ncbi:MAG: late competence development ComFB family protein [Trichodesmium sp. MO_231.B1]|uniref:late competence development ComFB family protein n=1 Tax=Okeania sp. SIO2F4 TaxID=2607790 RepID=UPI0025D8AA47|nr:late competence development ComFB family protein [Okeania sp. SIO2F4]MDJ0517545.1 late competence development ComFB family protein [Trichodesmium sp. MO_231.B1]
MVVNSKKKYINIMEQMVADEVNRQITLLPQKLAKYIKRADVETYALNRLPPLYASSKEGWKFQTKKAEEDYQKQIVAGVRHAFAAVQRDLLKSSTPLFVEETQKAFSSKPASASTSESEENKSKDYSWHHSRYYRLGSARK